MYRYGSNDTLTANYAVRGDFCEAFVKDMKPLYLLAFLLTANHQDAEQCFRMALEAASEAMVFRDWVRPWIRRTLLKAAIRRVLRRPSDNSETRDSWWDSDAATSFNAVAQLGSLERLVFVMAVLEGYSIKECSLLLDRSEQAIVRARLHALKDLSSALGIFARDDWREAADLPMTACPVPGGPGSQASSGIQYEEVTSNVVETERTSQNRSPYNGRHPSGGDQSRGFGAPPKDPNSRI